MEPKPQPQTTHVEKMGVAQATDDAKRVQVLSVALNDALARDKISPWAWSTIKLYGIMALTTLSTSTLFSHYHYLLSSILTK